MRAPRGRAAPGGDRRGPGSRAARRRRGSALAAACACCLLPFATAAEEVAPSPPSPGDVRPAPPGGRTAPYAPADSSSPEQFDKAARFSRSEEDYRFLLGRGPRSFPLDLKELPVLDEVRLSVGGDYRARVDSYAHPSFGRRASDSFTSVQNRFLMHGNVELTNAARIFLQLGAATEDGRKPGPRGGDRSGPDVVQAFAEYDLGDSARAKVRIGRQEFVLGRYISIREATNFRRAFDGVRVDASPEDWTFTAFAGRQVVNRPDAFDDRSGSADEVVVASLGHPINSSLHLEGTFIDKRLRDAVYARGTGREERRTYSARLWGGGTDWSVDAQGSYQDGSFASRDRRDGISAYGLALQAEWFPRGPAGLHFGLRADTASGDGRPSDGRLNTFDIPYPNLAYLNDATIFAPRNNRDLQPYVRLGLGDRLTLTLGNQWLWRNSRRDAIYNAGNFPIVAPGGTASLVATQPYARMTYHLSALVDLQVSYVHALRGAVLTQAGATRDLDFVFGEVRARF